MKKSLLAALLAAGMLFGAAMPAAAAPAKARGNGAVNGCTLQNGSEYKNPGKMLQHLTSRDGHFQVTVDNYFDSVADLVSQKCGA